MVFDFLVLLSSLSGFSQVLYSPYPIRHQEYFMAVISSLIPFLVILVISNKGVPVSFC